MLAAQTHRLLCIPSHSWAPTFSHLDELASEHKILRELNRRVSITLQRGPEANSSDKRRRGESLGMSGRQTVAINSAYTDAAFPNSRQLLLLLRRFRSVRRIRRQR